MTERMSVEEFRSSGLLQEVNRLFFHPRGLAIGVRVTESGEWVFDGIRDHRDDPEGIVFTDLTSTRAAENAESVRRMAMRHENARGVLFDRMKMFAPVRLCDRAIVQPLGTRFPSEVRHDD